MKAVFAFVLALSMLLGHAYAQTARMTAVQIGNSQSVVLIWGPGGSGSGIVVDPSGLVMTVRHVYDECKPTHIKFLDGREFEVTPEWATTDLDGPALFKIKSTETFHAATLAPGVPEPDSDLYTIGFPEGNISLTSGKFRGGGWYVPGKQPGELIGVDQTHPGATQFNHSQFYTQPGYSGAPVFNQEDELCGLVVASGGVVPFSILTTRISLERAMTSYQFVSKKATLKIFTDPSWCAPCRAFENDYKNDKRLQQGLNSKLKLEFINPQKSQSEAAMYQITSVPTFVVEMDGIEVDRREGYNGVAEFVGWLKNLERLSLQRPQGEKYTPGKPIPPIDKQPLPNVPQAPQRPESEPLTGQQPESTPLPTQEVEEIDPNGLTIVVLIKKREIAGVKDFVMGLAPPSLQRVLETALDGRATVKVISERVNPEQFNVITSILGDTNSPARCIVLVPKTNKGFVKGAMVGLLEKSLEGRLDGMSVEPVFERLHVQNYASVIDAASAAAPETVKGTVKVMAKDWVKWALGFFFMATLVEWGNKLRKFLKGRAEKRWRQMFAKEVQAAKEGQPNANNGTAAVTG